MNKSKKIIISGGGTLGHILPIIPVVMKIYNDYEIYFIGTKKGSIEKYFKENNLNKYFKKIFFLNMIGINRKKIFKNIKVLFKYIQVNHKLKKIYRKIKPDLIIGMGGYISGVCIHQGIKQKIKTIIHEQNFVLGLSNKLVYKKVDQLLLAYDIKNIKTKNKKVIGNPRYNYVQEQFYSYDNNIILIVGGSLGSNFINDLILKNIDYFKFVNYKIKLIVGKNYYNQNLTLIKEITNNYNYIMIYDFLNNLVEEMSNATLIVSRSGATTISEIMALKKPSILIPSPNVTGNHQLLNALYLYKNGCCEMIEEKDLSKEELYNKINKIITNYKYKHYISSNIDKLFNNNALDDFIQAIKEEI